MNHKLVILLLAASASRLTAADDPHAAQRVELIALKTQFEKAVAAQDLSSFKNVFTPETHLILVTGTEATTFVQFDAYYAHIRQLLGPQGSYQVKVVPETTEFHGDLALVRGRFDEDVSREGRQFKMLSLWTGVLQKQPDGWKVLRFHVSMDPVDNPLVEFRELKAKVAGTGIGAIGGVLLGAGVAWWLARRGKS